MARKKKEVADEAAEDQHVAAPAAETTDLSKLVEKYVLLRERKQAIVNKAKEDAAKFDNVLLKIEGILLAVFTELGTDSVKTPAGTAYKSTRTSAQVADWDAVFSFIKDNEMWQMLERRVAKSAVEEYKAETGELPPGVNWREELTINVRRAS